MSLVHVLGAGRDAEKSASLFCRMLSCEKPSLVKTEREKDREMPELVLSVIDTLLVYWPSYLFTLLYMEFRVLGRVSKCGPSK